MDPCTRECACEEAGRQGCCSRLPRSSCGVPAAVAEAREASRGGGTALCKLMVGDGVMEGAAAEVEPQAEAAGRPFSGL